MKAIILAAGKATRLLPLTKETPQCLLNIKDKTILERQLDILKEAGVKDINVICGYLADKVEVFCKRLGIKTSLNPFFDVSGIAMTLWVAREELKEDCIIFYSDILFDSEIINGLLKNKGDICLAIKKEELREEAEKVIEKDGVIKNVSKIKIQGVNGEFIGIAKFSERGAEKLVKELNEVAKANLNASFIDGIGNLIKKREVVTAYNIKDAKFIDIDFPEDLKKAEELFK